MEEEKNSGLVGGGKAGQDKKVLTGLGLAVAILVLGLVSIPFSILLVGGIEGLIGIVLAIVYLKKKQELRKMVWWGLGLSVVGLIASAGFGMYYYREYKQIQDTTEMLAEQSYSEWIGKPAADFTVKDLEGNEIKLSGLKGRRVILDFWATWCPPCRMEIPHFVKLRNVYDSNGLVIIGISNEDEKTLKEFREKHRINYVLASERNLPRPYSDVTSIPTTFFIGRDGIIRDVVSGYHDYDFLNLTVQGLDRRNEPNEPKVDELRNEGNSCTEQRVLSRGRECDKHSGEGIAKEGAGLQLRAYYS